MTPLVWFGFAGYPEILRVRRDVAADTRPGRFVRTTLGAEVQVGDWEGFVCFEADHPLVDQLDAVIVRAKATVNYHRAKLKHPHRFPSED